MKVLIKKNWNYTVYEEGENLYLEVVCGTSALFEVKIVLSDLEKAEFRKNPIFIEELSQKIRSNPSRYT